LKTGGKTGKAPEELPLILLAFRLGKTVDELLDSDSKYINLMLMYMEADVMSREMGQKKT
jgi:hypothetical protein